MSGCDFGCCPSSSSAWPRKCDAAVTSLILARGRVDWRETSACLSRWTDASEDCCVEHCLRLLLTSSSSDRLDILIVDSLDGVTSLKSKVTACFKNSLSDCRRGVTFFCRRLCRCWRDADCFDDSASTDCVDVGGERSIGQEPCCSNDVIEFVMFRSASEILRQEDDGSALTMCWVDATGASCVECMNGRDVKSAQDDDDAVADNRHLSVQWE